MRIYLFDNKSFNTFASPNLGGVPFLLNELPK
ncbi:MAG: hypothetical protein RIR05_681 [Bacteroidota bacterium]|jgi:hypothetical protein